MLDSVFIPDELVGILTYDETFVGDKLRLVGVFTCDETFTIAMILSMFCSYYAVSLLHAYYWYILRTADHLITATRALSMHRYPPGNSVVSNILIKFVGSGGLALPVKYCNTSTLTLLLMTTYTFLAYFITVPSQSPIPYPSQLY